MKKYIVFILAIAMICLSACSGEKKEEENVFVEVYKSQATEYLNSGDFESARKVLEEGYSVTNDEGLKAMLDELPAEKNETEPVEENPEPTPAQNAAAQETAPAQNAAAQKKHILNELTQEQQRTLNIFLSNFSEARMLNYSESDYHDSQLIEFAFTHNDINNYDKINYIDNMMGISYDNVNTTLQRYLGKTVPRADSGDWVYMNDGFYTPVSLGESYAIFSIATDLIDNNDGTLDVEFSVFYDRYNSYETALPEWYSYTPAQAKSNCDFYYTGTAKIRPKTYNGKNTYELITYNPDCE